MAVVDFHTHVFAPDVISARHDYTQRDPWFRQLYGHPKSRMASAENLIAALDASSVDAAVTFGFAWKDLSLCKAANDYVIDAIKRWPNRLYGLGVVNVTEEGAVYEAERCMSNGLCGVGELMPQGQDYSWEDPRLGTIIEVVQHHRGVVMLHAGEPVGHQYPGKTQSTLEAFYQLALRHPAAKLVAAHWGGGLWAYELMPEVQRALRNVYYDTAASPLLYHDAVFSLAVQLVPDKVLFGTDFPLLSPKALLGRVQQVGLSPSALQAVLGGTALQLLTATG